MSKNYLANLDAQQLEAVTSPNVPLAVMAGAGAGKTKVITARILHQIDSGADPSKLFVSAFTRAAANEMMERVSSYRNLNNLNISTFHSLMFKFLNSFNESNGFVALDICKESRKKIFFQKILEKPSRDYPDGLNLDVDVSPVISIIGRWKNSAIHHYDDGIRQTLSEAPKSSDIYAAALAYPLYEKFLSSQNLIDFDDMLLKALDLLSSSSKALEYARQTWNSFFIDEAQDTNLVQWSIIQLLADPQTCPNLTVVGDLRQCLFTFRGATPELFEQFVERYKAAVVVDLTNNYRCSGAIVNAANSLASNMNVVDQTPVNDYGFEPEVFVFDDYIDQANTIADDISRIKESGESGSNTAVLVRTNSQSLEIESAFVSRGLSYWCNGGGFFDRMEVGDIVAYLKLANGVDELDSLSKIINRPTRYLGAAFVEAVELNVKKYGDMVKAIRLTDKYNGRKLSPKQRESAISLSTLLLNIREKPDESISPLIAINKIISSTEYLDWLRKTTGLSDDENSSRLDNLETLKENASRFTSVKDFLQFVEDCLRLQVESNDSTQISTIHRAKGSEWKYVWIANMHEDSIPHIFSKAEGDILSERRIAYVAMTRATEHLKIGVPELDGRSQKVNPSRFIYDAGLSI